MSASRPGLCSGHAVAHGGEVVALSLEEQGVVDRHERREVLVERRRLDTQAPRHLGQAETVDAFCGHDVAGDLEDFADRLLASPGAAVRPSLLVRRLFALPVPPPSMARDAV